MKEEHCGKRKENKHTNTYIYQYVQVYVYLYIYIYVPTYSSNILYQVTICSKLTVTQAACDGN